MQKKISKFFGHFQFYFIPNIFSSILDGANNFDSKCCVDIYSVPIQDTYTYWNLKKYNMEPKKSKIFGLWLKTLHCKQRVF